MEEDNHQMINFAASSSSVTAPLKKYDVFLSFRGDDTRNNFISHLHDALRKEVETYIDYRLEKGDEISQALIQAIQDSHVSVVIFSENYASSKWCLDELTEILKCKRDHGQIVIPVFYKVDPSDIRNQRGSYKEAFAKHEQDLKKKGNNSDDKLQKWRCALTQAANLAGWGSLNRNESEFIKDIVKDVLKKLNINIRYPIELKGVIGIRENYAGIESLLEIGSTEVVRMIGIWGMGGIGKTTLARALYDKLFHQFEGHCFLKHVREQSEKNGLDVLRKRLFSELLGEENLCVESYIMRRRLRRKSILIVLDDVATSEQLEYLISGYDCFAPGSRVIVTTRDRQLLSQVNGIREVKELNYHHSSQLFCLNAFIQKHPKKEYEELLRSVIEYCKGNPLALKVLGGRLRSRSIKVWESELRKLHKIPDVTIHNVLKLSFDGLDRTEQDIFLDIACFLKGEKRDYVTSLLDACDFYATVGIENLIDKSLITISKFGSIEMHDLIQEMGREIIRQESEKDHGRRSRLWDPVDVLKNNKGTEAIECIILDVSAIKEMKELHLSFNSFTKMTKLRILKFFSSKWTDGGYKICLPNGLESLGDKLRHLEWPGYCLEYLPSTFCAEMLVNLIMPDSNVKKLWDGVQNLVNLKKINLRRSKYLIELPDLSQATKLEVIRLKECISLREVHPSILSLHKLLELDLEGCTQIESLEFEVHSKSLWALYISKCSSLKKLSLFSEKLEDLWLDFTKIHELPSSIWRCEKLTFLDLRGCYNLESFGIGSKSSHDPINASLMVLNLSGCKLVNESNLCLILDGMRSLIDLYLQDCCNLRALPDCIGSLTSLELLHLSGSINVEMLSPNIKKLLNLEELRLDNCRKLVSLPELPPSLVGLNAINCTSLRHTDFTHLLLPVVTGDGLNWSEDPGMFGLPRLVILPGSEVPDMMFAYRGEGDSISFPHLPHSDSICRFICCLILPHLPRPSGYEIILECYINNYPTALNISDDLIFAHSSISDHVLVCSTVKHNFLQGRECDSNSITFESSFREGGKVNKIKIKRCGVIPVYASQDLQQTIPITAREIQESIPAGLAVSNHIWNTMQAPQRIKMFLWKACSGAILVKSQEQWCFLCRQEPAETFSHALLHCSWTRPVWYASQLQLNPSSGGAVQDFQIWFMEIVDRLKSNKEFLPLGLSILAQTISTIWKERNDCYFQNRQPNPVAVVMKISAQVTSSSMINIPASNQSFKKEESSIPEKHIIRFDMDLNQTIEMSEGEDLSANQVDSCSDLVMFEKSHTLVEIDNPHRKICKRKTPSFRKEESLRPEKQIIRFDIDFNKTIEVSEGEDLSDNQVQVDNSSELVMFEESHTLMEITNPHFKPDWDPIAEVESMLCDSYKVSPMCTHSTISISQTEAPSPNVKANLEKLETLLETSLEIISSNDEFKQQFHYVLEKLVRFEDEVPARLHPVICKLKTLIEGFDSRFATAQKTIQDYDQLLQSRSLLAQRLKSVKAKQDQIKSKVFELKMQFGNINSEIGEQEKESSVLVEDRDRLKRELEYYEAEDSKLKAQVAQWVPECQKIITTLKNCETAYQVAVTNKKKYEDEWAHMKNNFVANKF